MTDASFERNPVERLAEEFLERFHNARLANDDQAWQEAVDGVGPSLRDEVVAAFRTEGVPGADMAEPRALAHLTTLTTRGCAN